MLLTTAQKTTLKTFILADPVLEPIHAANDFPLLAIHLNTLAAPDFMVWATDVSVTDILDQIDQTKYTPSDTPDAGNAALYTARANAIAIKQMNLQNLIFNRQTLDASKPLIRANLRDAVITLPAGANGANVNAGGVSGVNVLTACTRKALLIEKVLNTGNATTGTVTAALMGAEGTIRYEQIVEAML